jgi:hypothetical protein
LEVEILQLRREAMTLDSCGSPSLEDAIEEARQEFAHDKMHRYVVYDGNSMYHVATLEDIDIKDKYAGYPTLFSTFQ